MKTIKKILLTLLILFVVSSIGGYFYFNKKFTPPQNYLNVAGVSDKISLKWNASDTNKYAAVLLPVYLEGIEKVFYMQLDFGSPITVFYLKSLNSIASQFSNKINLKSDTQKTSLNFSLGSMNISSDEFRVFNYGEDIKDGEAAVNIIGTIGTDLLEKRVVNLNFKEGYCSFYMDQSSHDGFTSLSFNKRRILLPVEIGGITSTLFYDSGTSGYQLITDHKTWDKYRLPNEKTIIEKGNSWGKTLDIISAPANQKIKMGDVTLDLTEVTYIEGTSTMQNVLMRFSGMQGMIGNKLFLEHKLTLDCKKGYYRVE